MDPDTITAEVMEPVPESVGVTEMVTESVLVPVWEPDPVSPTAPGTETALAMTEKI